MRVLLVYPDITGLGADWHGMYYHGVAYLASVLKKGGHQVELLHACKPIKRKILLEKIRRSSPQMIGFSSTTNMFPYVEKWLSWVKHEDKNIFCIVGGIHATTLPAETINNENIDAICIGEGEYPVLELANALQNRTDRYHIQNIWIKERGIIYKNDVRPLIEDLDVLPFPDREIFDFGDLSEVRTGVAAFMATRGCPYNCSYCCNHLLKKIYKKEGGGYLRFRSPEKVISEILYVTKKYPQIKRVSFDDDILPLRRDWFRRFVSLFQENVGLEFTCNLRLGLVDEELVDILGRGRCVLVSVGIESGSEFIRNKVMRRNISNERIEKAVGMLKKAGIQVSSYNMLGLPFESVDQMLETVKLNAKLGVFASQASIFYPYKGTDIYDLCEKNNLVEERILTNYFYDTILKKSRSEKYRIIFLRQFFQVMVRIYAFIYNIPASIRRIAIKFTDYILKSKIISIIVFPLLISLLKAMRNIAFLDRIGRTFKNKFLERLNF